MTFTNLETKCYLDFPYEGGQKRERITEKDGAVWVEGTQCKRDAALVLEGHEGVSELPEGVVRMDTDAAVSGEYFAS